MAISQTLGWNVTQGGSDTNNGGASRISSAFPTPSAPTVNITSGGAVTVGTYFVGITFRDTYGESAMSSVTSATTTSGNQTITIVSPSAPTGAFGNQHGTYNVYIGTASAGPYYLVPVTPGGFSLGLAFGTNTTITATPPSSFSNSTSNVICNAASNEPPLVNYALSNSAQVHIDNSTITATTVSGQNTLTFTGYTPTANDVGNLVNITAGTNTTTGRYEIVDWTSTTWVVTGNSNLNNGGGAGSAITGFMGGALSSPGLASGLAVNGNKIWIKYSATAYSVTATTLNISNGGMLPGASLGNDGFPTGMFGYESTYGDFTSNRPTIKNNQSNTILAKWQNLGYLIDNIIWDLNGQQNNNSLQLNNQCGIMKRCKIMNAPSASQGILIGNGCVAYDCEFTGASPAANLANTGFVNLLGTLESCVIHDMGASTGSGGNYCMIYCQGAPGIISNCIIYNTSKPSSGLVGINFGNASTGVLVINTTVTNCSSGIAVTQAGPCTVLNSVVYNNGDGSACFDIDVLSNSGGSFGAGVNVIRTAYATINPSFGNVASILENNIILTATPFTNSSGSDFSLNSTAGGGSACKDVAFPTPYPVVNSTNYKSLGALQVNSQGGALLVNPGLTGNCNG